MYGCELVHVHTVLTDLNMCMAQHATTGCCCCKSSVKLLVLVGPVSLLHRYKCFNLSSAHKTLMESALQSPITSEYVPVWATCGHDMPALFTVPGATSSAVPYCLMMSGPDITESQVSCLQPCAVQVSPGCSTCCATSGACNSGLLLHHALLVSSPPGFPVAEAS